MNSVVLMGRLTRDPEVRYSQDGSSVGNYTLAVDRRYKREGEQVADFIRCIVFNKSAEFAEKYFRQGTRICVHGRIQTGSYKNREGRTIYTTDVVVDNQEFAQSKSDGEKPQEVKQPQEPPQESPNDGFMDIPDGFEDELPFA